MFTRSTKPSMAVVLWQPPSNPVSRIISQVAPSAGSSEDQGWRATIRRRQADIRPADTDEDANNNEAISNLNWNARRQPDVDMEDV